MVKVVNTKVYQNDAKKVIVVYVIDEFNNSFKGKAKCNDEDEFNYEFGEKLAYLRAKKKMVNFYKKTNLRHLEATRKSVADFEERMKKELDKHDRIINRLEETINNMLDE